MTDLQQILSLLFRWSVAVGLLVLILYNIDGKTVWEAMRRFSAATGALMLVLNSIILMLMALRWKLIAQQLSVKAGYRQYLRAVWLGALSGQIGPPLIFSEVARFKILQKHGEKKQLISSQVLDRLSGQVVSALIFLLLLPVYLPLMATAFPDDWVIKTAVTGCIFGSVSYGLIKYCKHRSNNEYQQIIGLLNPFQSPAHYAISLLIQLLLMTCFTLAAAGLGSLQKPLLFIALLPLVFLSLTLLPISISDWGTREATALLFLSFSELAPDDIVAASIIYGTVYSLTAVLGIVFITKN